METAVMTSSIHSEGSGGSGDKNIISCLPFINFFVTVGISGCNTGEHVRWTAPPRHLHHQHAKQPLLRSYLNFSTNIDA
ncbi:hypothetical protein E2C01_078754 [Portunus trituberculatus]|uniref:Uncharacterized protein n=1 Tax=Portunus trituberculatus TaxID=210409 RepID=A0A5B7IHP4_PORTR|nr:hypothetical protein [Portunus trituberculatus]